MTSPRPCAPDGEAPETLDNQDVFDLAMNHVLIAAELLGRYDFAGWIAARARCDTLGYFLDPTLMRRADANREKVEAVEAIVRAADTFVRAAAAARPNVALATKPWPPRRLMRPPTIDEAL